MLARAISASGGGGSIKVVEKYQTFSRGNNTVTISELSDITAVVIETTNYGWVSFAFFDDSDNFVVHSGYSTYWRIVSISGNQIVFLMDHPNYGSMDGLITVIGN